ncbi:MAG: tyrosine-protein phosphatase [Limnochordia bacterium]
MIDLHAHLLPGVDDGPSTWQEALEMLRIAQEDGVKTLVATSHQEGLDGYHNTDAELTRSTEELQRRAQESGMAVTLLPGGEVRASPDLVARLERKEALTLADGGRYLLLEFPASEVPLYTNQLLFELQVHGITPIIAHPERNAGFAERPEALVSLVEAGALVQLTAASLSSRVSVETRTLAVLFLTHNLAHVLASDAHSATRRPPVLARYVSRVAAIVGEERALSLVKGTPERIVRGEPVVAPPTVPISGKSRGQALKLARALSRKKMEASRRLRWFRFGRR